MGMFDYIRTEAKLPEEWAHMQERHFQTKDLGCELEDYVITKDGELHCKANGVWSDNREGWRFHHGDIVFYDWEKDDSERRTLESGNDYGPLVYFRARFTEGKLAHIQHLRTD